MAFPRRLFSPLSGAFTFAAVMSIAAVLLVWHPETPLPPEWNPVEPLDVTAPVTPVTGWKLEQSQSGLACHGALATANAAFALQADLEDSDACHIRDRLTLRSVAGAAVAPVETRCATALHLALWTEHGLQPAAERHFGAGIARIEHLSSYNCRPIRTARGIGNRMSTHATASAIDITGFTLTDGRRIRLIDDWGDSPEGAFLREARDSACDWFGTTLGPDYNALHADHFHLQLRGRGLCR